MLNSKNALSQKYPQPQKKEPCEILQKKFQKKFSKKKIQKKIEERLPRFSRSQIGGGGGGAYTNAMVIAYLYERNRQRDRQRDRHGDMERMKQSRERKRYSPFAYCLEFVGLSLLCFSWFRFLTSIKKFFNFPNFFSNYLIFNAFQI